MASSFLNERIARLSRIFYDAPVSKPLLKAYPCDPSEMIYLAKGMLKDCSGLDNITPNGAVMERAEIEFRYPALRAEALAQTKLRGFWGGSDPILRAPYAAFPDRPYATDKWHSDIWRGEPRHSLNVIIPLWGCEDSIVKFREPIVDTFRPLDDYAAGDTQGEDYDVPFIAGMVYYFDAMLLHRTDRLRDRAARVSMDFRMLYKGRIESDISSWEPASKYAAFS